MKNVPGTVSFDVQPIDDASLTDAVKAGSQTVFTLNLAHIRLLSSDHDFRKSYMAASVVTLDSRFLNIYFLKGRHGVLTGSDFVRYTVARGTLRGCSVLIIGNLEPSHAARLLAGSSVEVLTPSFGFYDRPEEIASIVGAVGAKDPDIIFIAVGAPQSERLARELRTAETLRGSIICCGAAFEFLTGKQTRAPSFVARFGAEWLWRIYTNPRRLLMRYLQDAVFILRNAGQFLHLAKSRVLEFDGVRIHFPPMDRLPATNRPRTDCSTA
jgi:N-acetylglucosaminyldiphosphoundecaprenol N-acetyl-beta-D-mannosaminyltransferase